MHNILIIPNTIVRAVTANIFQCGRLPEIHCIYYEINHKQFCFGLCQIIQIFKKHFVRHEIAVIKSIYWEEIAC